MFRKVTIALLANAALGMLAPDVVSARGGGGGGFHGGGAFHRGFGGGGFHRDGGFDRGRFHAARFSGRGFRGAAIGGRRRAEFRFENFHHTGPIAGTSRLANRMTGSYGQRTGPEVVHCLTSDCRLWHSYRDESDENRRKRDARPSRNHDELRSDHLDAD